MADHVADKLSSLRTYLADNPDRAAASDSSAVARLTSDLRCEVHGPDGAVVTTAMPQGLGGDASAPSPGWYARCAVASCAATSIALRAAEAGLELDSVEVEARSTSDARGLLAVADVRPGFITAELIITVSAPGCDRERLEQLVKDADLGSPVGESLRNGVAITTRVVHVD